ncbi:MAG: HDIG domain-containing protein [Clostridia bacterium]|nr:HDIG domain-containing protein [Clostridia bacterium]
MKKQLNYVIQAICIALMTVIIIKGIIPQKYDINVGDISPADIYATRSVEDRIETEKRREKAAEAVETKYEIDYDVSQKNKDKLEEYFKEKEAERTAEDTANAQDEYCLTLSADRFEEFKSTLTEIHEAIMDRGVRNKEEAIEEAKKQVYERLGDNGAVEAAGEIFGETIDVNASESEEKTQEEKERVKASVPSVIYKENEKIVGRGEAVTESQYAVLAELGLVSGVESMRIWQIIGAILFVLICVAIVAAYILLTDKKHKFEPKIFTMTSIVALFALCVSMLSVSGSVNKYILPVAAAAAILAILTEVRFSLLIYILISTAITFTVGGDIYYFVSVFVAGCICIFLFSNIAQRRKLVFLSLIFCVLAAASYFAIGLLQNVGTKACLVRAVFGIISALLSSVIVMGTLPFWENVFDIITPFRLSDLANPNQPLLKRLLLEAPGTYHHSLMVGNLAEAACEKIGGNYLLARTGAYYHDIGKLSRPEMFTENQYGINPHDTMEPEESAQIIIKHVTDGRALAKEYKLPETIKNIIMSHHGKTPVAYFLNKARKMYEGVDESKFRYNAQLPATKEEAVVMLADSCEAAVRSLDEKSESSIKAMIEKIFAAKISDSQLGESPITFEELETIQEVFIKVFSGYFHSRVKYPEYPENLTGKDERQ